MLKVEVNDDKDKKKALKAVTGLTGTAPLSFLPLSFFRLSHEVSIIFHRDRLCQHGHEG